MKKITVWVVCIMFVMAFTPTSTFSQEKDITICFHSYNYKKFSTKVQGEEEIEFGIEMEWLATENLTDPDTTVSIPANSFDSIIILHSHTDSLFQTNTIRKKILKNKIYTFRPVDQKKHQYLKLIAYREGVAYSSPLVKMDKSDLTEDILYSPAALVFKFMYDFDIWKKPYDVFQKSQALGQRAFDALALLFCFGVFILMPLIWWLFRSSRLFLINRDVKPFGSKKKTFNECAEIADEQSNNLTDSSFADKFKKLIIKKLSRDAFHGQKFNKFVTTFTPKFLELGARGRRNLSDVSSVKLIKTIVGAVNEGQDLERAIEIRISAEHEDLRKRSLLDVLWAFGATAPLLGLFGTVTGISEAFSQLALEGESINAGSIMQTLGGGIHEALFTTIMGLICGILFMSCFYYYSYKLDRIYSLWTTFGADSIDMLKNKVS